MQKYQHFNFLLNLFLKLFKLFVVLAVLMSLARVGLFLSHESFSNFEFGEILSSLFLGFRLDCSILAYIFALPTLVLFLSWLLHVKFMQGVLYGLFRFYFYIILSLLVLFYLSDYVYFSFFGEHSTLMIFGVFDYDTTALVKTAWANYNVPLVAIVVLLVVIALHVVVSKIVKKGKDDIYFNLGYIKQGLFFLSIIVCVGLLGRGSFTLFPLAYNTPDPTSNHFLNIIYKNPVFALIDSYNAYEKK